MRRPFSIAYFMRDETGTALVSYAVLVFIIGLALGAGASLAGLSLKDLFSTTASTIDRSVTKVPPASGDGGIDEVK